MQQVFKNTESAERQYALKQRAVALGWQPGAIVVIDCDQGQSGASAADRHGFQQLGPVYFFALVMIWSFPDITADRIAFNVLWTGWIVVGTCLEERNLVVVFGDAYRDYQRRVPMLLPVLVPATEGAALSNPDTD